MKRPPVIAVLGHVDHGKTTLLDSIRKSNVADKEEGGITQCVGAYEIEHKGEKITFIDTPGHAAFSGMRSRGANIADLAILVVAADDGVKPQTKEAIDILKEAKIPFVVAINKIDKNNANLEKTKLDLSQNGVLLEGAGGDISFQEISAKSGQGVDQLLDLVVLASDIEEFKYDPNAPASGFVLEAHRDNRAGNTINIVLKNGTLNKGDELNTKSAKGKVKQLQNFKGEQLDSISPSSPAIVLGFETLPKAGESFGEDVELAEQTRKEVKKPKDNCINLILRADLSGTLEALSETIKTITPPEGKNLHVVDEAVGDVSDGDIKLAKSTNSIIIAFGSKVGNSVEFASKERGVQVFVSKIIYALIEDLEKYFEHQEKGGAAGILEVLAVFNKKNLKKQLVGGRVIEGLMKNKGSIEFRRGGEIIGEGKLLNLQKGKEEADEVEAGNECGLLISASIEIQEGDKILIKA